MKSLLALIAFACVTASAQVPAGAHGVEAPARAASGGAAMRAPAPAKPDEALARADVGQDAWQSWGKWATLSVVSLMVLHWLRRRPV